MKPRASKFHISTSDDAIVEVNLDRRTLLQLISLGAFQCISSQESIASQDLPKAYTSLADKIATSLRESISAEAVGAPEAEVRRKADPAKENVKEFVARWRGDQRVSWHPSHQELVDTVTELSAFYRQAGPRSKLSSEAKTSILSHLDKMEASLKAPLSLDTQESDDEIKRLKGLF
jgi:DNA polymerase III alpha subunit